MITASALSRLMNCDGSIVLPKAENFSPWAAAGNEAHEELAHLDDLPPELAKFVPPGARSEVKLSFDVATGVGRIIGEGAGRGYGSPGAFDIVGSTDFVGVEGDAVVCGDWKSGFRAVEPASSNPQLWFYGLAAASALGKSRAIVRIIYTQTGRLDEYEIDALELAVFASRLRALHEKATALQARQARGEAIETREGSWCRHCASVPYCASKNALLVQLAENGLAVVGDSVMTPDRAVHAYEQLVRVEQLTADARKRLQVYVDENGAIDLGNGKMYGRYVRGGNEVLNGNIAVTAIREVVGESAKEFEMIAIERKTSKAAIARAAKQLIAKGHTKVAERVIERVRELGGATHGSDSMPYGEFSGERQISAPRLVVDADEINKQLKAAGE